MDSIQLLFSTEPPTAVGQSKWWGAPDLPKGHPYPVVEMEQDGERWHEPLTFLCQVHLPDIAPLDTEGWLPHEGMLYFFAAIDYFLDDSDLLPASMGEWPSDCVRVIYSPSDTNLEPYVLTWEGTGESVFREPVSMTFAKAEEREAEFKLLGKPYYEEINEQYEDSILLLQVDENDDWGLRFYDCGMLCLLMHREDLFAQRWDKAFGYLHSF